MNDARVLKDFIKLLGIPKRPFKELLGDMKIFFGLQQANSTKLMIEDIKEREGSIRNNLIAQLNDNKIIPQFDYLEKKKEKLNNSKSSSKLVDDSTIKRPHTPSHLAQKSIEVNVPAFGPLRNKPTQIKEVKNFKMGIVTKF